jgi:hypothetical protein
MAIEHLIKLNGEEITEHGRKFDGGTTINASNIELNNGNKRRYIKNNKNIYNLNFTYLPSLQNKTIDNRKARDYLYSIARTPSSVSLSIKLDPEKEFYNTVAYVESYSETLIKRDLSTQCSYYDVQLSLVEA